jgi:hypothetical protein
MLLRQPADLAPLAAAARRHAEAHLDWDVVMAQVVGRVYRPLVAASSG